MGPAFERGFAECYARYGLLLDGMTLRRVNGFSYTQVTPFDVPGPEGPMSPKEIGEEIGRRAEVAAAALEGRIWRDDMERWDELKESALVRHRELYAVELDGLEEEELADHVMACGEHVKAMVYQHHSFNVSALFPVGRLMLAMAPVIGVAPPVLLGLLDGYSPVSGLVSSEMAEPLAAIALDADSLAVLDEDGDPADRLARLCDRLPAVADYMATVGYRLVDGFDISFPTLGETPQMVLGKFAAGLTADPEAARRKSDSMAAEMRKRVPEERQSEFDMLLEEARAVYRLRDERGIYSDVSAYGLMRLAAMEVGRRMVAAGRMRAVEDAFDARVSELRELLRGGGPGADELAARSRRRAEPADPPRYLGDPPPARSPMEGLPEALATVMSAVGFAVDGVRGELPEPAGDDRLIGGIAASAGTIEGRACHVRNVEDLFTLEQGDVMIARTTGEAFNAGIHLLGAIVTDHGSFASHAGIMAREMGFPAVVGTVNGSSRIPDGARVRVDGDQGEVTVLPEVQST